MQRERTDVRDRARAWRHAWHAAACDVVRPWAFGTVVRATDRPAVYDLNAVRVEEDPRMTAAELAAFADDALAGLAHRKVDVELADVGTGLRPGFAELGWRDLRLLWMRHAGDAPDLPAPGVEEVPYDAVHDLRVAWHREDFPSEDPAPYLEQARVTALRREVQVLAVREEGVPVAFAQIERADGGAEVSQVYVRPDRRGGGHGTAMTAAAVRAAADADDLWIAADDEDRPKALYARLGFVPVWVAVEFLRLPG